MSTDVDNYLAHVGVEVTDEIRHYGRKGMKWGQRKNGSAVSERKLARLNRKADRGDVRIANSKDANGARLKVIGREVIAQVLATTGATLATNLISNPTARNGALIVANMVATGTLIKSTSDLIDINKSEQRREG